MPMVCPEWKYRMKIQSKIKIHDSKGKLFYICPFLDKIIEVISLSAQNKEILTKDEIFYIIRCCESIRTIAKHLRGEDNECGKLNTEAIFEPYNLIALLKNIRLHIKSNNLTEKKLDQLIEMYM